MEARRRDAQAGSGPGRKDLRISTAIDINLAAQLSDVFAKLETPVNLMYRPSAYLKQGGARGEYAPEDIAALKIQGVPASAAPAIDTARKGFKRVLISDGLCSGEILVDDKCRTSQPGIYAAGDVTNVPYKQIVVAIGEGAKVGLAAFEDCMVA